MNRRSHLTITVGFKEYQYCRFLVSILLQHRTEHGTPKTKSYRKRTCDSLHCEHIQSEKKRSQNPPNPLSIFANPLREDPKKTQNPPRKGLFEARDGQHWNDAPGTAAGSAGQSGHATSVITAVAVTAAFADCHEDEHVSASGIETVFVQQPLSRFSRSR